MSLPTTSRRSPAANSQNQNRQTQFGEINARWHTTRHPDVQLRSPQLIDIDLRFAERLAGRRGECTSSGTKSSMNHRPAFTNQQHCRDASGEPVKPSAFGQYEPLVRASFRTGASTNAGLGPASVANRQIRASMRSPTDPWIRKAASNTWFIRTRRSAITRSREGSSLRPDCSRSTAPTKARLTASVLDAHFPTKPEHEKSSRVAGLSIAGAGFEPATFGL